jgi:hypothetical protein
MWNGLQVVFPGKQIKGCLFHWTQAVWRHVQGVGLQQAYKTDEGTTKLIRKLFTLPLIPHERIPEQFALLKDSANTEKLQNLFGYVERTWMNLDDLWKPASWCVFMHSVRTNNDVEGWHHRLNHKAGRGQIQFYLLIRLLHDEARLVPIRARLVREKKLQKLQRKKTVSLQAKLYTEWTKFNNGHITTAALLRSCSHLNSPHNV